MQLITVARSPYQLLYLRSQSQIISRKTGKTESQRNVSNDITYTVKVIPYLKLGLGINA